MSGFTQTHVHALSDTHPLINYTFVVCKSKGKRHEADRIRPVSESADYSASYSGRKLRQCHKNVLA